jgi:UDP-GlcNAc:undecaprenyl-phosphate GlcNAc-1-phosphate transferase
MTALLVVVLAATSTAAICPWLIGFLQRRSMVDQENGRTSHRGAVPRGGGLAVIFGIVIALVMTWDKWIDIPHLPAVALFTFGFGLLGLIDDIRTLPAMLRLVTQAVLAGLFMIFTGLDPIPAVGLLAVFIAGFWIMAFVNAFNFMDGINGISAATTCIIGTSLAIASYRWDAGVEIPALAVVGAALGFAPFNAMSARVFLGDVGSYLLGAGLALLAVVAVSNGAPVVAIGLPFLLYAADVAFTFASRAQRRERVFKSHREHVYQRLTQPSGFSHQQMTMIVSAFTVVLVFLAQVSGAQGATTQVLACVAGLALVISYLRLPTLVRFRVK